MAHPEIRINKRDGKFTIELVAVRCNSELSLDMRTAEPHELGKEVQDLVDVTGWAVSNSA